MTQKKLIKMWKRRKKKIIFVVCSSLSLTRTLCLSFSLLDTRTHTHFLSLDPVYFSNLDCLLIYVKARGDKTSSSIFSVIVVVAVVVVFYVLSLELNDKTRAAWHSGRLNRSLVNCWLRLVLLLTHILNQRFNWIDAMCDNLQCILMY